jgi:putative redox protein
MSTMTVTFPGGKRVDAEYGGYTIRTDQPPQGGGEGSAPPPFDLFLASMATCAGIYVKGYCDSRGIATEGLGLEMQIEREPEKHRVVRLVIEIKLPEGFPEKHREAVIRAADLCAVKKHILNPPAFEIRTV